MNPEPQPSRQRKAFRRNKLKSGSKTKQLLYIIPVFAVIGTVVLLRTSAAPTAEVQFLETFDTPAGLDRLRWEIADGRPPWAINGLAWHGDHDQMCGGATSTRSLSGPLLEAGEQRPWSDGTIPTYWEGPAGGAVYWCREHVMTSYNTEGYAHIDFMPDQVFTNVQQVCWDMNATNLGGRKWIELSVIPETTFQAHGQRMDYVNPEFAPDGPGGWGMSVQPGMAMITIHSGSLAGHGTLSGGADNLFISNADKMTRLQTCVYADGRVDQTLPDGSHRITDLGGSLPQGQVRVIWADVSYNPDKSVGESPPTVNPFFTWHWDNIKVTGISGSTTPPPTTKIGDTNGDGVVNLFDLSTLLSNWNKTNQTKAQGDVNGDGTINLFDLSELLNNWG